MRYTFVPSPLGDLLLFGDGQTLSGVCFPEDRSAARPQPDWTRDDAAFATARGQLGRYFDGALTEFDLPLAPVGTAFQQRVWAELRTIPYGATTTYGALASRLGDPRATRAVGLANGRNPLPILIPCHRVIGADGSLTGYGGGIPRKRWLLALEGRALSVGAGRTAGTD